MDGRSIAVQALPACGRAISFESRVRLVVPFPAGRSHPIVARPHRGEACRSARARRDRRQPGGAGGNVGAEFVARSPPDGYTYWWVRSGTQATTQRSTRHLASIPPRISCAVAEVASAPVLLVANPKVPINSVKELIAHRQTKRRARSTTAAPGNGSPGHLRRRSYSKAWPEWSSRTSLQRQCTGHHGSDRRPDPAHVRSHPSRRCRMSRAGR